MHEGDWRMVDSQSKPTGSPGSGPYEDLRRGICHPGQLPLHRRDFQFSIKRLLIAMTACGLLITAALRWELRFVGPWELSLGGSLVVLVIMLVILNDWSMIYVGHAHRLMEAGNYQQAIASYTRAVHARPDAPDRYCDRAVAHLCRHDLEAALRDYSDAIRLQPRYVPAWLGRASLHYDSGKFQKAVEDATISLCLDPDNLDALRIRGFSSSCLGEFDQALEDLGAAIDIAPRDGNAHLLRAQTHLLSGCQEDAVNDYLAAQAQIGPNDVVAIGLATARFRLGQYQAAIEAVDEILRTQPQSVDALCAASWFLATCPEDRFRDGRRALELACLASRLADSDRRDCRSAMAAACAEVGRFDEAIEHGRRAVELAIPSQRPLCQSRLDAYMARQPYRDVPSPRGRA